MSAVDLTGNWTLSAEQLADMTDAEWIEFGLAVVFPEIVCRAPATPVRAVRA